MTDKTAINPEEFEQRFHAAPTPAFMAMIEVVEGLIAVYREENESLDRADSAAFMALQDKKMVLARLYQKGIQILISRREDMKAIDAGLKQRLQILQADFAAAAEKNMNGLNRLRRATEMLSAKIMAAARRAVESKNVFSYGETGTVHARHRRNISMGLSETA